MQWVVIKGGADAEHRSIPEGYSRKLTGHDRRGSYHWWIGKEISSLADTQAPDEGTAEDKTSGAKDVFEGGAPSSDARDNIDRGVYWASVHCRGRGPASIEIHLKDLPLIPSPGGCRYEKWCLHWIGGQLSAQHISTSTLHAYHKLWQDMKAYISKKYSLVHDWSPHPVCTYQRWASATLVRNSAILWFTESVAELFFFTKRCGTAVADLQNWFRNSTTFSYWLFAITVEGGPRK